MVGGEGTVTGFWGMVPSRRMVKVGLMARGIPLVGDDDGVDSQWMLADEIISGDGSGWGVPAFHLQWLCSKSKISC